jgi:hypothetical protein
LSLDNNTIIREIEDYVANFGGNFPDWYVGIASNPKNRLFQDHNVNVENDSWIHKLARSLNDVRAIEDHFHNVRHADGAGRGGDNTTVYIYAYRKTKNTRE